MDFTTYSMINRYERICALPESELDRRWEAVRTVMRKHDVPVTVFANVGDCGMGWWLIGGSSKLPSYIIFPLDGEPTAVYPSRTRCGEGFNSRPYPGRTPVERGIYGRVQNVNEFQAGLVKKHMRVGGPSRVGFVNPGALDIAAKRKLASEIPGMQIVDIGRDVAKIRSVKSEFDVELCRASAQMHRIFLETVPAIVRIGRTEKEVLADLHRLAMDFGSGGEDMCLMMHLFDSRGAILPHVPDETLPGRRFQQGDLLSILLETSGPGGQFTANLRYWSFGDPTDEFLERYQVAEGAQDLVQSLLKPGVSLRSVADQVNAFIRGKGHYTDDCCYMHSMGYTMGEYPVLTDNSVNQPKLPEEDDPLAANTILLAHPHVGFATPTQRDDMMRIIETYLVREDGAERLTTTPRDHVYVIR